jgi:hypothetical protein
MPTRLPDFVESFDQMSNSKAGHRFLLRVHPVLQPRIIEKQFGSDRWPGSQSIWIGKGKHMNAAQIVDEVRKLSQIDQIEIYRWIDREVAQHLFCRIGMDRSLQIRQEFERRCNVIGPERPAAWKNRLNLGSREHNSLD